MNNRIIIHPCGHFEEKVLDIISGDIKSQFRCTTDFAVCSLDISEYYNPGRRQYDANKVMKSISQLRPEESDKIIGLLRVDIFVPILTYIFGQAELSGSSGVASLYRLRNELYGLGRDNDLLIYRLRKVVIHEIGHMYGLIHCHKPGCIMRSSTYVEDIDQKDLAFCGSCREKIDKRIELSD